VGGGRAFARRPIPAHLGREDEGGWKCGLVLLAVAFALTACASKSIAVAQTPPETLAPVATSSPERSGSLRDMETDAPPVDIATGDGTLTSYLSQLRVASCPAGVKKVEPREIELKAARVPLQGINPKRRTIGQLTYLGGFHLTSGEKRFGGLSDLKVLPDGNLLAESDQGDFVWLDLDADGVMPKAARIAAMLDAAGKPLEGKRESDAEGLAYKDGLAFISFERDHRVLAYDIGKCGAAARGAPINFRAFGLPLPQAFAAAKLDVPDNSSVEALGITPDWYLGIGVEQQAGGRGPLSLRPVEAPPDFNLRIEKNAPDLVSVDFLPDGKEGRDLRAFTLHRGFDSLLGNAITITETKLTRYLDQSRLPARIVSEINERSHNRFKVASSQRLAEMSVMLTIDNYEGLAARRMPDGKVRLYVISDDNFSASQRTLLMVFELAK